MAEAPPPESASPESVIKGLEARRDQLQRSARKFRFRWLFLFVACLIGTGFNVAIDLVSGAPSLADWYQGGLAGVILYLVGLGLIRAGIWANLTELNRTLAGGEINPRTSPIPTAPPGRPAPAPETNWKDRPLAVAAISAAGTALFMVTVVIPIWDKEKDNQIAELKTEPTKLKNELGDLRGQLNRMESENLKLRRDLDRLSPDSLFSLDDVYPKGFRSIRIGDRTDLITKVYGSEPDVAVEDEGSWISVDFKNPRPFSSITYYYDEGARLKTVSFIVFRFDNKDGQTFQMLKQQLIDKYSQSKMREVKGVRRNTTELEWSGINKHVVRLGDGALHIERPE
jgi:hypothetical protein